MGKATRPDPALHRMRISDGDFGRAVAFITEAQKYDWKAKELVLEGLMHSAIIFYARPFSFNARRGEGKEGAKLEGIDVEATVGDDLPLHSRVIHMRNRVVAHADFEFYPTQELKFSGGSLDIAGFVDTKWSVFMETLPLDAFLRMASAMQRACYDLSMAISRERARLAREAQAARKDDGLS